MNNCEVRPFIFVPTLFVKILFCGREKKYFALPPEKNQLELSAPEFIEAGP